MKPWLPVVAVALTASVLAGSPEKPKVSRSEIAAMEKSFDQRLSQLWNEPFLLLGPTRGFYLDQFGAVFTTEMNLVNGPNINPFMQTISKAQIEAHRKKKLERVPALKQAMRKMLTSAAASLDGVPDNQQIVVEVTLAKYNWENMTGVPTEILMQAQKKALLDAQRSGVDAPVREQEF